MKRVFKPLIITVFSLLFAACSDEKENVIEDPIEIPSSETIELTAEEVAVMQQNLDFSFDMFRAIVKDYAKIVEDDGNGNFATSPFSGVMCLAMIANSCDDGTAEEISKALGNSNLDDINSVFSKLISFMSSKGATGVDISLANSVWYAQGNSLSSSYTDIMSKYYYSEVNPLDFTNEDLAVETINSWCAKKTDNLITHFLDGVDPSTTAAWYNAMLFKGGWEDEFDPAETTVGAFHGRDKETSVRMMHKTLTVACAEYDDFDAVKMIFKRPSVNEGTTFTAILPHKDTDLDDLASRFTGDFWTNLYFRPYKLTLAMPSFNIAAKLDFCSLLSACGINLGKAGLDRMGLSNYEGNLNIGQQCTLDVDEKGAVAAVITGSDLYTATCPPLKELTFDRPFIFFIENEESHTILLAGQVNNLPNAN